MTFDLNGGGMGVLSGAPNEFSRMRFDGLNRVQFNFTAAALGVPQHPDANGKVNGPQGETPVDGEDADEHRGAGGRGGEGGRGGHGETRRQSADGGSGSGGGGDSHQLPPDDLTFEEAERMARQLRPQTSDTAPHSWLSALLRWF